MVWAASLVCIEVRTRWPVSAAVMAAAIVSPSRTSPMRMTSGILPEDGANCFSEAVRVHTEFDLLDE